MLQFSNLYELPFFCISAGSQVIDSITYILGF